MSDGGPRERPSVVLARAGRAAGASDLRMWVDRTSNPIAFKTSSAARMPADAEEIDLSAVTATNAFSAVVLYAVSLFL